MPAAHNAPGFTSFTDYLNANAGSLGQERQATLGGLESAGAKLQGELPGLQAQASKLGADWAAQNGSVGVPGEMSQADQDQMLADAKAGKTSRTEWRDPGNFDVTQVPGFGQFTQDRAAFSDQLEAAKAGGVPGGKYGAFEAGLINASPDYQQGLAGVGSKYGGALSGYLDQLQGAARAGALSYAPPATPAPDINLPPSGEERGPVPTGPERRWDREDRRYR